MSQLAAMLAVAAPTLIAFNLSPSPTFLNQAAALLGWGSWLVVSARSVPSRHGERFGAGTRALLVALVALGLAALAAPWWTGLPASLAFSAVALIAAAMLTLTVAGGVQRAGHGLPAFESLCLALLLAGIAGVSIAVAQVFAPTLADGTWIAASSIPGRAVGNLRQPNHLSSLLLWSTIAVVALVELGRLPRRAAVALLALFVFGVVLTASRTGLVSVGLLALWGVLDRRLSPPMRALLLATPLVYAAAWFGMAQWAALSAHTFGGSARLAESDISGSRFAIWANTLELIRREPWLGVGFGEFNLAWTLTPFPDRPTAFFDHTHNLPLQLAVELGLPLAALVMALLLWALWQGLHKAWRTEGPLGHAQRAAMLMVLMIGLHSLLEYPLWYAYFLLPTAWAWGFALAGDDRFPASDPDAGARAAPSRASPTPTRSWRQWAGAALAVGAVVSVFDYLRVASIFDATEGAAPLEQRIEAGRRSIFFAHHADYAAVTSGVVPREPERSFASTTHYLLDTRLMIAWAEWLESRGEHALARHLAARLREFRKPDAESFFAPCADPQQAQTALQCQPPARTPHWREYLRH